MTQPLKNVLSLFLDGTSDWKMVLIQNWPHLVGNLHQRMRLEKIEHDALVIGVYDHHWMHELHSMSRFILHMINAKLDQPRIKQLRFVLAVKKRQKKDVPRTSEEVAMMPRTLSVKEKKILARVRDKELQQYLKALAQRLR